MKKHLFYLILILFLNLNAIWGQTNYADPREVAQKFLELYFQGNWFDACKSYATSNCDEQLSFMLKRMETDDNYVDEGKCSFKIDTCIVGEDKTTARCLYTKTCANLKKPLKHVLNLLFSDNKWLVDYLWRRDKFL
jgi:hypothetical protein